jgi:DNA-binding GntR family transcriptional regulator
MAQHQDATKDSPPIYDDLHSRIIRGALPPGTPLVENTLANDYGVSRSPVREALTRLTYEGLVERHDRGQRVRVLRPEDVLDLYEVRIGLEATAARAAARRRSYLDLARLRNRVEAMQNLESEDGAQRAHLAHGLHFAIWTASHNQALIDTLTNVQQLVTALSSTTLHYPERWQSFVQECVAIVDAISNQDADRAGEVANAQMTHARDFRVRLFSAAVDRQATD